MKLPPVIICIGAVITVTAFLPAAFVLADARDPAALVGAIACIFTAMMAMVEGVRAARQIPN
jgi:hypothetical protein